MSLKFLSLQNFRNYREIHLPMADGITVFTGENGMGKTTILEAISLLGSGKSFRSAKNIDFILHQQESGTITADINNSGLDTQVKIKIYPQGKKVFLNEKLAKSTQPLFDLLPAIIFSPSDHKIIEGDSGDRKQFLNRAASNLDWEYAEVLNLFNKTLLQRNKILKDASREHWNMARLTDILSVWDDQLIQHGSELIKKRKEYLKSLAPHALEEYGKISGKAHTFGLEYQFLGSEDIHSEILEENLEEKFRISLKDSLRRDLALESTQVGPHKDEILLTLNGNKVKFYGSQGEKRTCALALRLGELALFRNKLRKLPILLFDDVSSELDQSRRHSLVDLLRKENTQVLITATELPTMLMGQIGKSFQHLDLTNLGERN